MQNVVSNEYLEAKIKEIEKEMIVKNTYQQVLHPDMLALKHNSDMLNNQISINFNNVKF